MYVIFFWLECKSTLEIARKLLGGKPRDNTVKQQIITVLIPKQLKPEKVTVIF